MRTQPITEREWTLKRIMNEKQEPMRLWEEHGILREGEIVTKHKHEISLAKLSLNSEL